jgi:hypothetical protein
MRRPFHLLALGLGVAIAVGLTAAPASAGEPPVLKVAKNQSGPYQGTIKINVGPDQSKDFFIKARHASVLDPEKASFEQPDKSIYKTKYFKGDENITDAVLSDDGFDFMLKDTPKKFRGVVKDIGNAPDPDCIALQLQAVSGDDSATVGINAPCF